MACNSCAKPYTLLRKERGCPCCGYSYCSKCLNQTIFVTKLNSNAKVCTKCSNSSKFNQQGNIEPPDAYYKLVGSSENVKTNKTEREIKQRLQSLKEGRSETNKESSEDKIRERLENLKGPQPSTSDAELETRLANLRGIPTNVSQNKTILWTPELKTEQEQADDLLKCYLEQANIEKKYKDGFEKNIENIETRLQKIKGTTTEKDETHSEDEETEIKKIIEKVKAESLLNIPQSTKETNEELPFCEICNEDANMRCLGCLYLFCKRCFLEHKDDDDGCNKYEPYKPPHPS